MARVVVRYWARSSAESEAASAASAARKSGARPFHDVVMSSRSSSAEYTYSVLIVRSRKEKKTDVRTPGLTPVHGRHRTISRQTLFLFAALLLRGAVNPAQLMQKHDSTAKKKRQNDS